MTTVEHLAAEYLLNSLWQVPLLCATAWVLARMVRRLGPEAEHRVWVGALFAEWVLPGCAVPHAAAWLRQLFAAGATAPEGAITITLGLATAHTSGATAMLLHGVLLLCVVVNAVFALRFAWQLVQVRMLVRTAKPLLLQEAEAKFVEVCCERFGIASVELASAEAIETPVAFGFLRPMLLLPDGFVQKVSAAQLRTALSHELAHVSRQDAAKHTLYRAISLAFAYHPAAWLTLANLAETRERVCDRLAALQTGGARQYARSLLELASLLTAQRPAQTHAIGLFDANQFERRILMLHRKSHPLARPLRVALIATGALAGIATCTTAVAMHVAAPYASDQAKPQGAAHVPSNVAAGLVVNKVTPVYPPEAKEAKVQGTVVLAAIIGKTGNVEQLRVVSGPEALQQSALDAVKQWVYKPYLLNGVPTDVDTTITVNFSLVP